MREHEKAKINECPFLSTGLINRFSKVINAVWKSILISGSILGWLCLGYAGDRLLYMWRAHLTGFYGKDCLPPLSQWLAVNYGYNENDLLGTAFLFSVLLICSLLLCRALRPQSFGSNFWKCLVSFWILMGTYLSFLSFCAALPFYYLIRALDRPFAMMPLINYYGIILAIIITAGLLLYRKYRQPTNDKKERPSYFGK